MPNQIESQIKERIEAFVTELDLLVRRSTLESLRGVLGEVSAPARRGPGRPRGRARASASVGGDSATAIVGFVRANDGVGVREIAAGVGLASSVAKKAVAQLLATGALKKSGQRRGTKYHSGSGKPAKAASRKPAKAAKRGAKKRKARKK